MINRYRTVTVAVLVAVLSMGGLQVFAEAPDFGAKGAMVDENPNLETMLTYAIQDEYLAKAEYELIIGEYGTIRPFSNIVGAEEQHIGYLVEVFNAHGLAIPEDTAKDHVVLPADLKTAFETGVQAEIDNIAMYESFLARDLPDDVRETFEKLMNASKNHLRAFRNNLRRYS